MRGHVDSLGEGFFCSFQNVKRRLADVKLQQHSRSNNFFGDVLLEVSVGVFFLAVFKRAERKLADGQSVVFPKYGLG